ncbi:MAG: dynamin family protein [Clostridium sp.]
MKFNNVESEYKKLEEQFNLFKNITKSNNATVLKVNLNKLEKMINDTLPNNLSENAPPNFPQVYFDFKYEYSRFKEFILYEHIIGKIIVALGGGFSSGKSSFLNSLMKKPILPSEIDPSTSVPAYIVNGIENQVYGVNAFDAKINMGLKDIKVISHGFGEVINEEDEIISQEITLGHILKSLFLVTPLQTYKNIAFLDTPGYSKPDTETYSAKTDEKIARVQLNSSNYILWFVQADSGIISEEDINFINTLNREIPKLIIVNKADKRTKRDLDSIIEKIKEVLDLKGIQYVDVLTYSRSKANDFDSAKIKAYLEKWNGEVYEANFAYNFKKLFVECKEYYEKIINEEGKRLNRLNRAITLSENDTVTECLSSLINEIKRNIVKLKDISSKLKELQDEFFKEIKSIADIVGIQMPEPSEIDFIKNKIQNPLEVIKSVNKKNGIKTDINLSSLMKDVFSNVISILNKVEGGSEYKNELLNEMKKNTQIEESKIRFNDINDNNEVYKDMMKKILR